MQSIQDIFNVQPELKIREELIGIHAINPFNIHNSASRNLMMSSHIAQSVAIENGDEKIIQTGLETQLGEASFSVTIPNDAMIIGVVRRYNGVDITTAGDEVSYTVMFKNLDTDEIDCIEVKQFDKYDVEFGFKLTKTDAFYNLAQGQVLEKDTVLAETPTARKNGGYAFGANANMALMSLPAVDEDAVIISESLAKKLSYKTYVTRVIEFGDDKIPLNIYGDENEYKAFPEIGEMVAPNGLLMGLRANKPEYNTGLMSYSDLKNYDPIFDECCYVEGGNAKVIDIKAYKFNKKKDTFSGTNSGIMKYVNLVK